MKTLSVWLLKFALLLSAISLHHFSVIAQGSWTQKASYPLAGRMHSSGFSINGKGYFIFGCGNGFDNTTDLVEYDPALNTWTLKAPFPGGAREASQVFVINGIAYVVSGPLYSSQYGSYNCYSDVWAWNPVTNTWSQKNNFPGTPRHGAFYFSASGKGYVGLGSDNNNNFLNDFWEYDPVNDSWLQKASYPGGQRKSGFQFAVGRTGYAGMGFNYSGVALSDVWEYDASTDTWTQKSNFPAAPRCWLAYFSTLNNGFIVSGYILNSSITTNEFWKYEPSTDTWAAMPGLTGSARSAACAFFVSGKAYTGLGINSGTYLTDFWEFTPSTGILDNTSQDAKSINVFPNPARNEFRIDIPFNSDAAFEIVIVDSGHKKVVSAVSTSNPQVMSVDCSLWSKGSYFVVIRSGSRKWVKPVLVN